MGKVLSDAQIAQYLGEGVLHPVRVLDPGDAARHRRALEETERLLGGTLKRIDNAHLHFRWAWDLTMAARVLDVMEDLLGPDLLVHSSRIFYKHPADPAYVGWHQDGLYARLDSDLAPSIWIALSPSTPENGCLRVVPRTHRTGKLPHRETYAADNLSNHGEVVAIDVDESGAIDVVLEPGEMSVHHVNVIHGSSPNRSAIARIGFSASFITPAVPSAGMTLVPARGCRSLDAAVEPPDDLVAGIASHAEYVRRHGRGLRLEKSAPA